MSKVISLEGVLDTPSDEIKRVYIVLTNTRTTFSRIAKLFTWDDYNHASIAFSDRLSTLYTFAMGKDGGGFKIEKKDHLRGADYKLYAVSVTSEAYKKITNAVNGYRRKKTAYSHASLVNTILRMNVFRGYSKDEMICSQFVLFMLLLGDVEGTENYKDKMSRVKPSDFKDMDFIDHVRDGTFSMEALPSHLNW